MLGQSWGQQELQQGLEPGSEGAKRGEGAEEVHEAPTGLGVKEMETSRLPSERLLQPTLSNFEIDARENQVASAEGDCSKDYASMAGVRLAPEHAQDLLKKELVHHRTEGHLRSMVGWDAHLENQDEQGWPASERGTPRMFRHTTPRNQRGPPE